MFREPLGWSVEIGPWTRTGCVLQRRKEKDDLQMSSVFLGG